MKTNIYQIKINRRCKNVRATSMKALSDYTKTNPQITDWRSAGLMSISELTASRNLEIVA